MKFRNIILSSLGFLMAGSSMANDVMGSVVLLGRGSASANPDYVSLNLKVSSICYATSQDAQAANAKLSTELLQILQNFKKDSRDKIVATGGANYRQTETIQAGAETKVLCELKWRSENNLTLTMAKMDDLAELQDELFKELNQSAEINPAQAEQTYAEVGRPSFGLYSETAVNLRNSAQTSALNDAKSQFDVLNARCGFVEPRLVSIAPPEFNYSMKAAAGRADSSYYSPVIPDSMEVQATLRLEWQFTPNSACKR